MGFSLPLWKASPDSKRNPLMILSRRKLPPYKLYAKAFAKIAKVLNKEATLKSSKKNETESKRTL